MKPPGRFGSISLQNNKVLQFQEKPDGDKAWINGGFFVLDPKVINLVKDDNYMWEKEPLEKACLMGEMMAYQHDGFWQCMDTKRDKDNLDFLFKNRKVKF